MIYLPREIKAHLLLYFPKILMRLNKKCFEELRYTNLAILFYMFRINRVIIFFHGDEIKARR